MSLVRVVQLLCVMAVLIFAALPSPAEAACACSRVGQSNGYYSYPSSYGTYGYGPAYSLKGQTKSMPAKAKKAKKKSSKSKPIAQ